MNKLEFTFESLKNLQDIIKFTDQKSGGILVLAGIMITTFIDATKDLRIITFSESNTKDIVLFILGFITIFFISLSIWINVYKILRPRLATHYKPETSSPIYFSHIANLSDKKILFKKINNSNEDYLLNSLTDQIYELSKIVESKMFNLKLSIDFIAVAALALVLFVTLAKVV